MICKRVLKWADISVILSYFNVFLWELFKKYGLQQNYGGIALPILSNNYVDFDRNVILKYVYVNLLDPRVDLSFIYLLR